MKMNRTQLFSILTLFLASIVLCFTTNASALEQVKYVQELKSEMIEPVDAAIALNGDVYVLDKTLSKVFVFGPDGKLKLSFGDRGTELGHMFKPQSIALNDRGDVIVADTGNNRVQVFNQNGHFAYELGSDGDEPGQFKNPSSVAIDRLGKIFVADAWKQKISEFSPNGVFLKSWSVDHRPIDITFDLEQNMYILYSMAGKIQKLSPEKKVLKDVSMMNENGDNELLDAVSLSVDMRGDLYFIENKFNKIIKLDQDAAVLFSFGSNGDGRGQFDRPASVVADLEGNIFIADSRNQRVQMLSILGSEKASLTPYESDEPMLDYASSIFAGPMIADLDMHSKGLYAVSDYYSKLLMQATDDKMLTNSHSDDLALKTPRSLYVYPNGNMLIADTGNHRLQFLKDDGSADYHFGKRGTKSSEFHALEGVAVSHDGYIYVADTKNHRIQIFSQDGIYLKAFGEKTDLLSESPARPGTFNQPKDLAFDSKDRLFVLDHRNKRIQVLTKDGEVIRLIEGTDNGKKFLDPIDFALDERDYLYVADKGDHRVHIFDTQGKHVLEFGSAGKGPSYFPSLSAIESANGKIYVADYVVDKIQVFAFKTTEDVLKRVDSKEIVEPQVVPEIVEVEEANVIEEDSLSMVEDESESDVTRIYITRTYEPMELVGSTEAIRRAMAQRITLKEIRQEIASSLSVTEEAVKEAMIIESEVDLDSGMIELRVSVPQIIENKNENAISMM